VTATSVPAQQSQASKHWPATLYRRPDGAREQDISPALVVMAVISAVIMWWLKKNRWL